MFVELDFCFVHSEFDLLPNEPPFRLKILLCCSSQLSSPTHSFVPFIFWSILTALVFEDGRVNAVLGGYGAYKVDSVVRDR
jgi:hypothetical protein